MGIFILCGVGAWALLLIGGAFLARHMARRAKPTLSELAEYFETHSKNNSLSSY